MPQLSALPFQCFSEDPEGAVITPGGQAVINVTTGTVWSRPKDAPVGSSGYVQIGSVTGGSGGALPLGGDLSGTTSSAVLDLSITGPNNGTDGSGIDLSRSQLFGTDSAANPILGNGSSTTSIMGASISLGSGSSNLAFFDGNFVAKQAISGTPDDPLLGDLIAALVAYNFITYTP